MYKVKALINFDDIEAKTKRKKDDIFEVSKERFDYLNGNNPNKLKAVELIEIKKEVQTIKDVDKALERESAKEEVKRKPTKTKKVKNENKN